MKNLALIATFALGLFAAVPLHAQNTQNALDPSIGSPTPSPKAATDATATAVRKSTRKPATAPTGQTSQATIRARNNARLNAQYRAAQTANIKASLAPRLDGGVVRAVRSNSPLQAVNPFAPAEYGSGDAVTRHEPDDPFQRPQGLKLLVVEF